MAYPSTKKIIDRLILVIPGYPVLNHARWQVSLPNGGNPSDIMFGDLLDLGTTFPTIPEIRSWFQGNPNNLAVLAAEPALLGTRLPAGVLLPEWSTYSTGARLLGMDDAVAQTLYTTCTQMKNIEGVPAYFNLRTALEGTRLRLGVVDSEDL